MKIAFSKSAFRQFEKLERATQKRIDEKLRFCISQKNPFQFAERIADIRFGQWRFRIGGYRVPFDIKQDILTILKVGHRRDIYK